jgi:uncharacterized protein (DUF433 family)
MTSMNSHCPGRVKGGFMASADVEHIVSKPTVCGGRPCIAGTRIRVQDIYAWHEQEGFSPDEIVARFPQLKLADVYAALAYFWDHPDEIRRQMQDDREFINEMKQSGPSKLLRKLSGRDPDDAVPPG